MANTDFTGLIKKLQEIVGEHEKYYGGATEESSTIRDAINAIRILEQMQNTKGEK